MQRRLADLTPRLRRFAWSLTHSREEGDDLAQTALLKALDRLEQYREDVRLDAWLFRIAYTSWLDLKRTQSRRPTAGPQALELLNDGGRAAQRAEDRLELEKVRARMAALPEEQRAALALVAIDGLSYQDAADALQTPIGTIMSRVARARKKLIEARSASSGVEQQKASR